MENQLIRWHILAGIDSAGIYQRIVAQSINVIMCS